MSGLLGKIDQAKVDRALLRYRAEWGIVFVLALTVNFLVLYLVFRNRYIVGAAAALYVLAAVFSFFFFEFDMFRHRDEQLSAEYSQPATPELECYARLWDEACARAGFCSGGVYVFTPHSIASGRYLKTLAVSRHLFFSKERRLLIREEMLGKFTEAQMRAMVLHEYGHMQWMPLPVRYAVFIVTQPVDHLLCAIVYLRDRLSGANAVRVLYLLERVLYFVSNFSARQTEEYAADAYAAKEMGTAKHFIDVLLKLHTEILFAHMDDSERRVMGTLREMNAHLYDHPLTLDRIVRLRALHGVASDPDHNNITRG